MAEFTPLSATEGEQSTERLVSDEKIGSDSYLELVGMNTEIQWVETPIRGCMCATSQ